MQAKELCQIDFTPKLISQVITFLKTKELPNITTRKEHELWDHFSEFRIEKKKLFLEDREVIPNTTAAINEVLTGVYKSPQSLGKGQNALFAYVQSKYIGVNRAQVKTFLKNQIPYQLGFSQPRVVNRGIVTTQPFQCWSYDWSICLRLIM
jgi:hypothetical protein